MSIDNEAFLQVCPDFHPFASRNSRPKREQRHLRDRERRIGRPIPGAIVKLTNLDTGIAADTTSNESSIYRFGSLVPGTYRLEADSQGFEHLIRSSVVL